MSKHTFTFAYLKDAVHGRHGTGHFKAVCSCGYTQDLYEASSAYDVEINHKLDALLDHAEALRSQAVEASG